MNGKIKCSNCGNMIPIGAPYCIFCSAKQSPVNNPLDNVRKRRKKQQVTGVPIVRAGEDVMVPVSVKTPESVSDQQRPPVLEQPLLEQEKTSVPVKKEQSVQEIYREPESSMKQQPATDEKEETPHPVEKTADTRAQDKEVSDKTQAEPENSDLKDQMEKVMEKISGAEETKEEDEESKEGTGARSKNKWKEKKEKKAAEFESTHDSLTGLYNLGAYEERLKKVRPENVCIIIGDANNLEKINEMYGHDSGDLLLKSIAEALQDVFGNNCYRIGDDEFAVVLERVGENSVVGRVGSLHDALRQQERKLREEGKQLDVRVAVGYAYGSDTLTPHDVENEAKAKMVNDKKQMKQVYNPNHDGYYDDVKAEYEEVKVQIDRENMHKVFLLLICFAIFMAVYFIFFI